MAFDWSGGKAHAIRVALQLARAQPASPIGNSPDGEAKWVHQVGITSGRRELDRCSATATSRERERFERLLEEQGDDRDRY